jgi:CRISPR-associated protein Cmr5
MKEQTLDQKRAEHAFQLVQQVKRESAIDPKKADPKQFKIQTKKLPARIVTSGLGQALAFLEAKNYAPHLRVGLSRWIETCEAWGVVSASLKDKRLLLRVIQGDSDFLRFATAECLAYLQWLVRFTESEFRDISDQE